MRNLVEMSRDFTCPSLKVTVPIHPIVRDISLKVRPPFSDTERIVSRSWMSVKKTKIQYFFTIFQSKPKWWIDRKTDWHCQSLFLWLKLKSNCLCNILFHYQPLLEGLLQIIFPHLLIAAISWVDVVDLKAITSHHQTID